jgi:DMSO/TMAO reductase YedYZ molybdopterin-dependent catalytic subunit
MTLAVSKPSSLRYYQDGPPRDVDLRMWRLAVTDLDGTTMAFSYDDLHAFPRLEESRRMVCVCNWSIRHTWGGVLLRDVLASLGRTDGTGLYLKQTSIGTREKGTYCVTIPLQEAFDRGALLVTTINGEPLTLERGYPLRLFDFGLYGYKCVKGLRSLAVTTTYDLGEWERRAGYSLDGTIRPKKYWVCDLRASRYVRSPGEVTDF